MILNIILKTLEADYVILCITDILTRFSLQLTDEKSVSLLQSDVEKYKQIEAIHMKNDHDLCENAQSIW